MKSSSNNDEPAEGLPSAGSSGWDEGKKKSVRNSPINETLQHVIGSQLKAAYDEVVRQPVPDRFLELLGALEAKQKQAKQEKKQ